MNRSSPQVFSNRMAARRLHRRPEPSRAPVCLPSPVRAGSATNVVAGLPESVVREAGMFELLAAEMRIAELEQALAEAREAALTDPLTGALNRRGFAQAAEREIARARRRKGQLALVHLDLDDFKTLNDSLGHHVGDRALRFLVDQLRASLRPSDLIARFGGEEFVVMLPDTSQADALGVVERFLRDFSARCIPGCEWRVSFSAGVTMLGDDASLEAMLMRADAATYAAKRNGKRCVVVR